MKVEYDKKADAAYIYLKKIEAGEVRETLELNEDIILDFDKDKKLIGIEILNASKVMPKSAFSDFLKVAA